MLSVMGLIFFLSSLPSSSISLPDIVSIDKFLHVGIYGLLAAAALLAVPAEHYLRRPGLISLAVVVLCLLYGISDECHQSFVPGRELSGLDLAADAAGAAAAVSARLLWKRRKEKQAAMAAIA
jgi:VanZ family protein